MFEVIKLSLEVFKRIFGVIDWILGAIPLLGRLIVRGFENFLFDIFFVGNQLLVCLNGVFLEKTRLFLAKRIV